MGNIHKYKTFKTVYPTNEEVDINKASRSAKLRSIEKLED
jgi:16S rRNA C1402 N4-methylase RsmH